MKRFLICLLTLALLAGLSTVSTAAADADYEWDSEIWSGDLQLHALYVQQGDMLSSDLAELYEEWWWDDEVPEIDNYAGAATINMRGFTISPDGKYAYLGTLNGGSGVRGVLVLNLATGKITDLYYHYDGTTGDKSVPFSFAKGLAADARGYVYTGFAYSQNYNVVYLGIAQQQEDGTLKEVSCIPVCEFGTPGDAAGTKVGVNGVDVAEINGRTYCYVVTNYNHDALYCFDVTDPAAPVLNEDFGDDGVILFPGTVAAEGFTLNEGQYMDIDEDGTIYLCVNSNEGKDGIMVIEPDGSECRTVIERAGIYCVELVGDFILCGPKAGGSVTVISKESYEEVATVPLTTTYGDRVVRMQIANDVLFVADAGADTNTYNAIHVAALSDDGQDFIHELMAGMNTGGEEETDSETDSESAEETESASDSTAETGDETAAETTDESASGTTAETGGADGTAVDPEASGCASALVSGGMLLLLAAAFVVCKKH